jgi:hypothetical protein
MMAMLSKPILQDSDSFTRKSGTVLLALAIEVINSSWKGFQSLFTCQPTARLIHIFSDGMQCVEEDPWSLGVGEAAFSPK